MNKDRDNIQKQVEAFLLPAIANKATEEGELLNALEKIAAIEDKSFGGDWDEIEEAREIARQAIAADRASRQVASFDSAIYQVEQHDGDWCDCDKEFFDKQPEDRRRVVFSRQVANKAEVEPELRAEIEKLTHYKHCMSYNDSYFGEPAGLVKQVAFQLDRLISGKKEPTEEAYSEKLAKRGAPAAEVRAAERTEAMHKGVVGVLAGVKAQSLATPPATTGASTAPANANPVSERELKELRKMVAHAGVAGADELDSESAMACFWSLIGQINKQLESRPVGASTVLTDERIIEEARDWGLLDIQDGGRIDRSALIGFVREVAAQAGQVAVPDDGLRLALKTIRAMAYSAPQTAQWISEAVHIADEALAAAPSAPAVAQQALADWISIEETEPPERELIALRYWPYDNRENPQAVTGGRYVDGTFYNDEGDELHPPSHWCRLPHFDAEATVQASTPDVRQEGGDRG